MAAFRYVRTEAFPAHFADTVQNYLVYTNTVLFINSGGDSRAAGCMLAVGTLGILIIGPVIIGYIPIMVVGALIFYLGFDLMREALVDTWNKVHRLEYLTVSPNGKLSDHSHILITYRLSLLLSPWEHGIL